MGSFSNDLENKILNHIFGGVVYTPPATVYVGVSTTPINEDGTGITEPVGNNYARVAVVNNTTNFPETTTSSKKNGTVISFPQSSGNWGNIVATFVSSNPSGNGHMIANNLAVGDQYTVFKNTILSYNPNTMTITID